MMRPSRITRSARSARTRTTRTFPSCSWVLLATIIVIVLSSLSSIFVQASPYIISDDRVRSLDITPTLGRGYSIMTDRYHSTCLMVNETTVPSYNYDYTFTEFISEGQTETELFQNTPIANSFAYSYVKKKFTPRVEEYSTKRTSPSVGKVDIQEHSVIATMRVERYYSSIREEVSPLSDDSFELLDRQDYIGFFKACGPSYVRSIRRAQEVTAIFTYESANDEYARQFNAGLKSVSWGSDNPSNHFYRQSKFDSITESMKIEIKGFGLGLDVEGSDTLYAQSLEEMHNVMKFAFRSMTQAEESRHIGQVYGIEIVPWVDNPAFQVASRILDDDIFLPIPRSLIPKAKMAPDSTLRCKNAIYEIDKFGYCCEDSALFNTTSQEYEYDEEGNSGSSDLICRPLRPLERTLVKENMVANGEFVARVDSALKLKLARISSTEKCLASTKSIADRYNYHILKSKDTVEYNAVLEGKFTVAELKMALDPVGDYGLVNYLAKEFDEFIDMFYHPCLAALFGANIGATTDTEAKYFMAYPWHTHDECNQLGCLIADMRWDRENGGCVPSLLTGVSATDYSGGDNYCSIEMDDYGDAEVCKYPTVDLEAYHDVATTCWNNLPNFSISYLIDHFCLPDVTGDVVSSTRQSELDTAMIDCYGSRRRKMKERTNTGKVTNIKQRKQ